MAENQIDQYFVKKNILFFLYLLFYSNNKFKMFKKFVRVNFSNILNLYLLLVSNIILSKLTCNYLIVIVKLSSMFVIIKLC